MTTTTTIATTHNTQQTTLTTATTIIIDDYICIYNKRNQNKIKFKDNINYLTLSSSLLSLGVAKNTVFVALNTFVAVVKSGLIALV